MKTPIDITRHSLRGPARAGALMRPLMCPHARKLIVAITGLVTALLCLGSAAAEERMVRIALDRGQAHIPAAVLDHDKATATLILLPGGDGGTGRMIDGKPGSNNFLARSRALFAERGFNVVVAFRASDLQRLEIPYRHGTEHIAEVRQVIAWARREFGKPVWLVGTSLGSISATAATLALGRDEVAGLVLTSSITPTQISGSVTRQEIERIAVPTLVMHHRLDACRLCVPAEAARLIERMHAAPAKKFLLVEGGSDPRGNACQALHWHGFINYERETVQALTDWIKAPRS